MKNTNPFIILTGKTASGKDTIVSRLLFSIPNLKKVITTTSRIPREGEEDKKDYNFISKEEFEQKVKNNEFIEFVSYGGNLYGTEKTQITSHLDQGLIWRIDPSRAGQIREFIRGAFEKKTAEDLLSKILVIYLTVSDMIVLERLQKRRLSQEEIQSRMEDDQLFWQKYNKNYDFIVENIPGKLDETINKILNILKEKFF